MVKPTRTHARLLFLTLAASVFVSEGPSSGEKHRDTSRDSSRPAPVLIELFTSQGCSSCPPADALLRELSPREDVVALSYHVDYWNRLGWKDPFSKREYTRLQEGYARTLGLDTIFTPQVVIDGVTSLVGSRRDEVLRALERHQTVDKAGLRLTVNRDHDAGGRVTLTAHVGASAVEYERPFDLVMGLAQNGIETAVRRGENSGRTLRHDGVVRELVRQELRQRDTSVEFELDEDWQDLTLFVYLQDQGDRMVLGAAKHRLLID